MNRRRRAAAGSVTMTGGVPAVHAGWRQRSGSGTAADRHGIRLGVAVGLAQNLPVVKLFVTQVICQTVSVATVELWPRSNCVEFKIYINRNRL